MLEPDASADVWEWEGVGLAGVGTRLIRLPKSAMLKHARETGNSAVFNDAYLVPDVTMAPACIHRGLERSGQDEAICYCGVPSYDFATKHGRQNDVILPPGFIFMVFMTKDLVVTKWRACEEAKSDPGFAIDHATRFGRRLWP